MDDTRPRLYSGSRSRCSLGGAAVALQPELASIEDDHAVSAGRTERSETAQFIEAVAAHDSAAKELLDPNVETVTPRRTLRGIAARRQVLQKPSGGEQFAMEQAAPEFEDVEGDVVARTHEVARWRETGEMAYERDFAVRLTLDDERIVRIVVMPESALPLQVNSGS